MAKLTLTDLASTAASSIVTAINNNNALIETALENTLSRDGTSPNQMTADLDMNSKRVYNLPEATADTEPVRLGEFNDWVDDMDAAVANAQAAATSAAASYDSFDDRYLGPKASAPTQDNDGNTLLQGALYFNTSSSTMFVWTGTAWQSTNLTGSTASDITFTPTGSIAATNVQTAIAELDTEKQPIDADLTSWAGVTRASGFDTFTATPSSANLISLVTDETGTGALVFANTPTLVTPILGTPTSGTLTNCTGLPLAGVVDSTTEALGVGSLEVGHASDTTITRTVAGTIAVEGQDILTAATGQPLDADLTAIAALTTTAAGRSVLTVADDNLDEFVVWDDSAGTMKTMPLADFTDEASPAAGDYVMIVGAEGDVRKTNWSNLPGAGGGAPTTATYVVMSLDGTLSAERTLAAGAGMTLTDGGANGAATLDVVAANASITVGADNLNVNLAHNFDWTGIHTFENTDLHIFDTDASHDLIIKPGSNLTVDRTLTLTTGDADRTIDLGANFTLPADPNADRGLFWDDSAGATAYFTATNSLEFNGTDLRMTDNARLGTITFIIDGGGSTITTGVKGYLEIPFACTINRATALADQSGSIVVDIWKDTYANYPPVDADSITASAPVTITTATKSQDATLTGWTTAIAAGDILGFNVDSITTCQRVTISLRIIKT